MVRWELFFSWIVIVALGLEASFAIAATKSPTTQSTTIAPTSVPSTPPTLPIPAKTTSRRITTQQDCFKQGRQVNCAWNPQVVVFDGYSRICEPTDLFLNISSVESPCPALFNETCRFDSNTRCVLLNEKSCRDAPLFRLLERGKDLLRKSSTLVTNVIQQPVTVQDVIRRSQLCADIINNVTCRATPYCVWNPSPETPAITVTEGISTSAPAVSGVPTNLEGSPSPTIPLGGIEQVSESQILEILSSPEPTTPDIKQIRVTSPQKIHERLVTITTQVRWAVRPENQTSIYGGWFTLMANSSTNEVSEPIFFNSSASEVQQILRKLPSMGDAVVRSNINYTDAWGRRSWVVNATGAKTLLVNEKMFFDLHGAVIPNDTARVVITKHQRNTQILMMFGSTPATDGNFLLGYTWVDFADDWGDFHRRKKDSFPPFATMLPIPERFQPNEPAESFTEKLSKFEYSKINVFEWVTVSKPDTKRMQELAAKASALGIDKGNTLRDAWIIEFTTLISEYERAEFPLTVMSYPVIGPNGQSVPFYGVLGDEDAIIDFSVQIDMPSPVVHGKLGKPVIYTANEPLPGLHAADPANSSQMYATWKNSSLRTGDCIRVAGQFYTVMEIETVVVNQNASLSPPNGPPSPNMTQASYSTLIKLNQNVTIPEHVNDTGVRGRVGWQAFLCRPILEGNGIVVAQVPSISTKDNASQIKTAVEKASNQFFTQVDAAVLGRDQFGTVAFNVSMYDADGRVPRLDFVSIESADVLLPMSTNLWNPQSELKVEVVDLAMGVNKPSGTLRLVFAGYGGKDEDALKLFESPLSPFYPNALVGLNEDAGRLDFANTDGTVTTLYYSDSLTIQDLRDSEKIVSALQSLTPSIVEFKTTGFAVDILSETRTRVRFLLNSIQFAEIWNLPANVPQLLVLSDVRRGSRNTRGILGTATAVRVFTEVQGVGTLYNQIVSSDKAEFLGRSPCRVEPELRRLDVINGYGDYASLAKMDELALNCAIFGGESRTKCTGPDAMVEGCIWRGADAALITDPPIGVDPKYLQKFWSTDDFFRWGEFSIPINSNCTVDPVIAVQYIVKLMKPMYDKLDEYNSSNVRPEWVVEIAKFSQLYVQLQSEVEKFDRCSRNPVVEAKATQGGFVDVWQWLVTTTSYTCMLAYGLAGALLAYRMDKFKLLGFKLRDASSGVLIILGSVGMGGVYGFVLGAVPAALISQMYASIPVNLSTDWAISLGVALGILIVYFDMGRGGAEAEIAFKRGH